MEPDLTPKEKPSTPSPAQARPVCKAIKADGTPCGATPMRGQEWCWYHHPDHREHVREAARHAGQMPRRRKADATAPDVRLDTVDELREVLADAISKLRRGEIDVKTANAIAYGLGVAKNVVADLDLDRRLRAIEGKPKGSA